MSSSNESKPPAAPPSLGMRGRKLWKQLQAQMEFDPQEEALLLETCRTLDTIESLARAVSDDGVMIVGSQGQSVLNPAVGELRQQQQSYARLVTMLNLGDSGVGTNMVTAISASARQAANARWAKSAKARRA